MAKRLFLNSVRCEEDAMQLGFRVGDTVTIEGGGKRRDLPGGRAEYAMTVGRADDRFDVRVLVEADGRMVKVHAAVGEIAENWYEDDE
jgi:hypothetical protein